MDCQHLPRLPQYNLRRSLAACDAILTQAETLQDPEIQRSLRRVGCELLDHALLASTPGRRGVSGV